MEWNDLLLIQLEQARNIPVKATQYNTEPYHYSNYHKTYDSWDDYDYDYGYQYLRSQAPTSLSNRNFDYSDYLGDDFYMYNTSNFTKSELIDMLGLNPQFKFMSNQD